VSNNKTSHEHKYSTITIKRACIDNKMIPIVKWLNSFEDIHTRWCCQGTKNSLVDLPYVVFYCQKDELLIHILNTTCMFANTTVDFMHGSLRYTLRFISTEYADKFIKQLKLIKEI
jgi:hypothetical protein